MRVSDERLDDLRTIAVNQGRGELCHLIADLQDARERSKRMREGMQEVHRIQGAHGNWDCDEYMHGMFNGMELMLSMAEGREPEFRNAPDMWLKDVEFDKWAVGLN